MTHKRLTTTSTHPTRKLRSIGAALIVVGVAGALAAASPTALAGPADTADKITVCHADDDGVVQPISVSARGARALLRKGDYRPGDEVPGFGGLVADDQCRPVFPYAQLVVDAVNEVRFGIDPACDSEALDTPCGPENGGLLPPVIWDQGFADMAAPVADACPVFSRDLLDLPDGMADNVYLHWSPDRKTDAEVATLAIQNWAEKAVRYDPVTGGPTRVGDDASMLIYKRLLAADRIGMAVRSDCPNNRAVAYLLLDPAPVDGPAYPPLLDED